MDRILKSVYRNTVCMYYPDVSGFRMHFGRYVYDIPDDSNFTADFESIEYRLDMVWRYSHTIDGGRNDHAAGRDQSVCDP